MEGPRDIVVRLWLQSQLVWLWCSYWLIEKWGIQQSPLKNSILVMGLGTMDFFIFHNVSSLSKLWGMVAGKLIYKRNEFVKWGWFQLPKATIIAGKWSLLQIKITPSVLFLLSVVLLALVVENCLILGKNLVIDRGWWDIQLWLIRRSWHFKFADKT